MTVVDYQDLIDRGWRRSGKYCYKPTMDLTCCPQYTIRQDATNYRLSKSHKKVIKRVNRYLISGERPSHDDGAEMVGEGGGGDNFVLTKSSVLSLPASDVKADKAGIGASPPPPVAKAPAQKNKANLPKPSADSRVSSQLADGSDSTLSEAQGKQSKKTTLKPGLGPDATKPKCRKAKEIRLEKKLQKAGHTEQQTEPKNPKKNNEAKSLEDFLNEPLKAENPAHHLEIKLVRSNPKSPEFLASYVQAHKVYQKYQMVIHKDPSDKPNLQQYTRFLVDSPLQSYTSEEVVSLPQGYGSFHQQYILDGKIIAVGVVDILPRCVSSVYLFYDPDYNFLSLGTYSALREIAFVRELHKISADLRWYYMGFYLHACPKMRYKGQYHPSYLLCPEAYTWIPIDKCIPKLNANKYSRLAEAGKEDADGEVDLDSILVFYKEQAMSYEVYRSLKRRAQDEEEVKEYASFVGGKCAQRMLLCRR